MDTTTPFGWKHSPPEAQGIDSLGLIEVVRRIRDDDIGLHSLIILRNGHAVLELYRHPYDRDVLHNVKSVTKSVMSAMVGVALDRGMLGGLDQPVIDLLPDDVTDGMDARKRSITLRHLLTMTSGLDLDENGPILEDIFSSDDWVAATFARPMTEDPGRRLVYCTALTHVMSVILSRVGGQSLLALCEKHLFRPLGMGAVQWKQGPDGHYFGGSQLFMTPRDMARIGLLFLNGGRWDGNQVVPGDWVRDSTSDHMAGIAADAGYGFWWWRIPTMDDAYMASGWGGQGIYVFPRHNMVAVATSSDPAGFDTAMKGFGKSIRESPLPANPDAADTLNALVHELAHPKPAPVPAVPALARQISGRTYRMADVYWELPFNDIAFDFPESGDAAMTVGTEQGAHRLAIGLDGLFRLTPTGTFGRMPCDNRQAVRGAWTGEESLAIEFTNMGDPNHAHLTIDFADDRITVSADIQPSDSQVTLQGSRAI